MLFFLLNIYKITLHEVAISVEEHVDRIIAEFPLRSCCSVYSVIEIFFIAIASDQSLQK